MAKTEIKQREKMLMRSHNMFELLKNYHQTKSSPLKFNNTFVKAI